MNNSSIPSELVEPGTQSVREAYIHSINELSSAIFVMSLMLMLVLVLQFLIVWMLKDKSGEGWIF